MDPVLVVEGLYSRYIKLSQGVEDAVRELQKQLSNIVTGWSEILRLPNDVTIVTATSLDPRVARMLDEIAEYLGAEYEIVITTRELEEFKGDIDLNKYKFARRAKMLGLKLKDMYSAFIELARNDVATAYLHFVLKINYGPPD